MVRARNALMCLVVASSLACGDDSMVGPSDASPDGTPDASDASVDVPDTSPPVMITEWIALARGDLFTSDLAMAQERHDAVAAGGRDAAMMAGDFAHDPMLGTTLLGSPENAFLATDRWSDGEAMRAFYADPMFAAGFAELFSGMPNLELFERRSDFHEWGDLDAADASDPRFFVVVRGRLASTVLEENRAMHDAVAAGGEEMVRAAGDVAHVVHLGLDDPREFLAIDVWGDDTNIEAIYGNPDFQMAFATLFEAPPSVAVYRSSGWESW